MKSVKIGLFVHTCCWLFAFTALWSPSLPAADSVTCVYDLFMECKDIGDVTLTRISDNDSFRTEESMELRQSGLWGTWTLSTTGTVIMGPDGILHFEYVISENGKKYRVFGERNGNELWCKKGNKDGLRIAIDAFDTTVGQLPAFLLKNTLGYRNKQLRVLDVTELRVDPYVFDDDGRERVSAAGRSFECRVFKAKTPGGHSTWWIAEDAMGAFTVKEVGKDKDGPYEFILRKY